jgi:AcrR family transcriptional regulator
MPRGFSEKEKQAIRDKLMEKGREFFMTYGVRKTSVEDLTRAAGISKGAFYAFFDSKEELFLEAIEQFEAEYRAGLYDFPIDRRRSPRQNFRRMMNKALTEWDANPLFSKLDRDEFVHLMRKLPEAKVQAHAHSDDVFVAQFMDKWKRQGVRIEGDPVMVSGLMKALFFVSLHKDDFGPGAYPQTMEVLIDLVAAYLVEE